MIYQNIVSPSFGSIKVQKSKMTGAQIGLCERISKAIYKRKEYHQVIKNNNIDIYMLPQQNNIEIRFLDSYSGNFIKNNNGEILNIIAAETINKFMVLSERIIDIFRKINNGSIARPKKNSLIFTDDNIDWAKLNPKKYDKYRVSTKFDDMYIFSDNPTK